MRIYIRLLVSVILISGCSANRYLLNDNGKNKKFLINYITDLHKNGIISAKPIIAVDGFAYRYDRELKKKKLPISKDDIKQIDTLRKDLAIKIYGEGAKSGVLLITTKSSKHNNPNSP